MAQIVLLAEMGRQLRELDEAAATPTSLRAALMEMKNVNDQYGALLSRIRCLAQDQRDEKTVSSVVTISPRTFADNMCWLRRLVSHTTAWNGNDNETVRDAELLTIVMMSQLVEVNSLIDTVLLMMDTLDQK